MRNLTNAECADRAHDVAATTIMARANQLMAHEDESEDDLVQIKAYMIRLAISHAKRLSSKNPIHGVVRRDVLL